VPATSDVPNSSRSVISRRKRDDLSPERGGSMRSRSPGGRRLGATTMVSVIFPLGVLLPTVFSRPALTSAATSSCRTGWIVQQQSLSPSGLSDVSAAGQGDAWAVGTGGLFPDTTLIEHWNGTSWKRIPSPSPPRKGTSGDFLSGVAALAPNNAWAVGGLGAVSGITLDTLIEHWNGSSWAVVKSASPVVAGNELSAVAAFSTKDIWAVGGGDTTSAKGTAATLALHWDGATWEQVSTPSPGAYNGLFGITTVPGTGQLWAVGEKAPASFSSPTTPLVEHWSGSRWTVSASPAVSGGELSGVTALGPKDAWAVGGVGSTALILHWNGSRWSRVGAPHGTRLYSIAAQSKTNAWAAGEGSLLHWNGSSWDSQSWPKPTGAYLTAVAVSAGTSGWTAWTVGAWSSSGQTRSLVLAHCS